MEKNKKCLLLMLIFVLGLMDSKAQYKHATFSDRLTIGVYDSENDNDLYGDIRALAVDDQQNVYIVDYLSMHIRMVNNAGEFVTSFGKRGAGPGEFASITAITVDDQNRLLAADWRAARLTRFDSAGQVETRRIDRQVLFAPRRVRYLSGKGYVFLTAPRVANLKDSPLFTILDEDMETVVAQFGQYEALEMDTSRFALVQLGFNPGYFDIDEKGRIYYFITRPSCTMVRSIDSILRGIVIRWGER